MNIVIDHRAKRAKQFSDQISHLLQDFLPSDYRTQKLIREHLEKAAYEGRALIVCLPPEFDKLTQYAAERAMRDKIMNPLIMTSAPEEHQSHE